MSHWNLTERHNVEIVEPKLFATVVADEIHASIDDCISTSGKCSLVLAGGRTPSAIYRVLSRPPKLQDIEWDKVSFYWGDERWVRHEDNHSNYHMVHETLLAQVAAKNPKIFPINTSLSSPQEAAEHYARTIVEQEKLAADELPKFDLVVLGCGTDGHIASIFPGSPTFEAGNIFCAAVTNPADDTTRITLSPAIIRNANRLIFIVSGARKAEIMRRVLEGSDTPQIIPAQLFRECQGTVQWFVDSGAAAKLEK